MPERRRQFADALPAQRLKAIAHPLRVQLLELLYEHGPATATQVGQRLGESSGTTSYHLRQLADAGLIEDDAERSTGRDRYWKPAGGWSLDPELFDDEVTRAAADTVVNELGRLRAQRTERWLRTRGQWPAEWQDASMQSTARFRLTPAEATELGDALLALVEEYRSRHDDHDVDGGDGPPAGDDDGDGDGDHDGGAGARRVAVVIEVIPTGDPPGNGDPPPLAG